MEKGTCLKKFGKADYTRKNSAAVLNAALQNRLQKLCFCRIDILININKN